MSEQTQSPEQVQDTPQKKVWYKTWWGVLLVIALFPVLVPYLVWTKTDWNKWVKITITVLCVLFVISNYYSDKKEGADIIKQQEEETRRMESIVQQTNELIKENKITEAIAVLDGVRKLNSEVDKTSANMLRMKINDFQNPEFLKRTLVSMSDSDFELLKNGELKTSFINQEDLNKFFLIKLREKRCLLSGS